MFHIFKDYTSAADIMVSTVWEMNSIFLVGKLILICKVKHYLMSQPEIGVHFLLIQLFSTLSWLILLIRICCTYFHNILNTDIRSFTIAYEIYILYSDFRSVEPENYFNCILIWLSRLSQDLLLNGAFRLRQRACSRLQYIVYMCNKLVSKMACKLHRFNNFSTGTSLIRYVPSDARRARL